jgi:hypothetical protein
MPRRSEPRLLVLHALRLKGVAGVDTVADAVGVPVRTVRDELTQLADAGLARQRTGALQGWSLTPAGRTEHERLLQDEAAADAVLPRIATAYDMFRQLNPGVLDVCSRWQVRQSKWGPVLNDHTDPAYDGSVIGDLADLHADAVPVCDGLAGSLERYGAYGPRLDHALERVRAGETDWFTKPVIASYHTVWFELHEDLLATLGIDRAAEVQGAS